jgi:large subunit ribosomal protein L4
MDVPVYNMQGANVGTYKLDEQALGGEVMPALIKQAYVRYHANTRQGSARTRNREAVEGATRKIYKQKGTGRARHGDKKVPQFKGGGHAHSKKRTREDYRLDMPKKMRRKANRNALLAKLVDQEVRIIDRIDFAQPGTKAFVSFLEALKIDRSALIAIANDNHNARLSGRNVENVTLCQASQLNCFDMLNHRYLVISRSDLEAWLKGPSSQIGKDAKTSPLGRDTSEKPAPKPAKPAAEKKKPAAKPRVKKEKA